MHNFDDSTTYLMPELWTHTIARGYTGGGNKHDFSSWVRSESSRTFKLIMLQFTSRGGITGTARVTRIGRKGRGFQLEVQLT